MKRIILENGYKSVYDFWLHCASEVISRSALSAVLAGKSDAKITSLMALCELLGVSMEEVLPPWPRGSLAPLGHKGYNRAMRKVLICGFMGCGKSTLLKRLRRCGSGEGQAPEFLDLDELIFQQMAKKNEAMHEMILRLGWSKFRDKERRLLRDLVEDESRHAVIALGGGSLEYNLHWLNDWISEGQVVLVWLDTPFTQCLKRIRKASKERPLASKTDSELRELYAKRLAHYSEARVALTPEEQDQLQTWEQLQDLLKS